MVKVSKTLLANLALLAANIIYGANYTIAKVAMPEYVKPFGFILTRCIGATALFWLVHSLFVKEKIERKDIPRLMLSGLFGIAINQLLFFKGLSITHPINAAILMTSTPILVLIVAAIMIRERVTSQKIIGIFSGLIGALMIILMGKDFSFGSQTLPGDLMVFINASSYGVYLVIVKPLIIKYQPITVIKWVSFFGLLMVAPFGYNEFILIDWANMPSHVLASVLYVVIGLSFFAYLLNAVALRYVSPSLVSIYIYSQPVFATIIALALGRDHLTIMEIIAAVLVFTGVYLVSKPASRPNPV